MSLPFSIATAALVAASVAAGVAKAAEPVGEALDRPALITRQAAHSVLLSAALAGERIVAVGERGIVVFSDDNGKSWRQARVPVSVTLTTVRFADATHGIAAGHGGVVLATSDGGESWTRRLDGRQIAQLALDAAKSRGNPISVKQAERLTTDGPDKPLLDLLIQDAGRAVVVGAYGLALETRDGGATWMPIMGRLDNPKDLHLYAVRARGNVMLIAGEQGLVLRSDDGGKSFKRLTTPYNGSFFTAELPSDEEIVLAGLRGNIWRSVDSGASWSKIATAMPVSFTGSVLRSDASFVLVNQAGVVFAGREGTIAPLDAPPLPPINGVLARPDGTLLAATIQGVFPVGAPDHGRLTGEHK